MNAINNSVYIAFLFIFSIVMSFTLTIAEDVWQGMYDALPWDISAYENISTLFPTIKGIFETSTNFLLAYLVMLTFVSSAVEQHTITSYLINFLGAILVSSLLLFVVSNLYSYMIDSSGALIDWTMIPSWYIDNFQYLLILQVIAGLLSFVFAGKGSPLGSGGGFAAMGGIGGMR